MKIDYTRQFLKDLEVLEPQVSLKIQQYIETLKVTDNISSARKMRKMVGYKNYYRLRFWEYRLWIKFENNTVLMKRFKLRKDIYKVFP